ncbi:MAG: histidinol-phosphate transaminase [Eubacteriales bacterium]|nr:histidinol-phosphate transaminase [Eubacteriales bacterium]
MSWKKNVRLVEPYVAGEQPSDPQIIKLNTNECPYPPAPGVARAAQTLAEESARLRLYPDMNAAPLEEALCLRYGLSRDQIFVGNGSDDVLAMCFLTFFNGEEPIRFPDITYSFYDVWASLYRIPYETAPLTPDFRLRPEDYLPEQAGRRFGGIIFPNPNAPTGVEESQETIERIVAGNPDCVVIVDEAYVDFGAQSALPLIRKYENLLVVQTFSKSRAMAGMRIGYAMGSPALIRFLKDVKFSFNSYTINLPSILLGTEAVRDEAYFQEITGRIVSEREKFQENLRRMGFEFPESKANFVFARHPDIAGEQLFAALRERRICVRHWNRPRIGDYLRITIGTPEQMEAVTRALEEIVRGV